MSEDLPFLDELGEARIKAVSCEAESRLSREVMEFLFSCAADDLAKLGHVPTSYDLLPFFVRYAEAVFDAEAKEYLKDLKIPAERSFAIQKLRDVAVSVRRTITRKKDGVWRRVVDLAIDYAGGSHETKLGYWDRTFFRTPLWTALDAALTVRAKLWESKLYDSFSTTEILPEPGTQAQSNQLQSLGIKPENSDFESKQVQLAVATKPTIVENVVSAQAPAGISDTSSPKESSRSRKKRREPHPDQESVFRQHPGGLLYIKAAEVLGLSLRRVQDLVNKEEVLETTGTGHNKRIPVESLRKYLGPRKK